MRFIILVGVLLSFLSAQPREALLIGNSNYEYISELNNPLANLKRLKKSLEEVGFNVKIRTELNAERLEEAIDVFSKRLAKDKETIGFVYYTGHGCQVNHQGYLLPINADSRKQSKIKYRALNINEMIGTLKESGNRVNMFFLDACRDIPVGTKGRSKGLGQIKNTPKGTLVVYATKDGEVAEDNSDFINSIISSVKEPKQSIRNLPYSISDVFKQGSTSQTPIFSAVEIPKVVLNRTSGYVPRVPIVYASEPMVVPVEPVYVPKPLVIKPKIHSTKNIVIIDGLMYQNQPFTKKYNVKESKKYCGDLTLGGYRDWRLSEINELKKIMDQSINNNEGKYYNIKEVFVNNIRGTGWFSTSTKYKHSKSIQTIDFRLGMITLSDEETKLYALCVRK